MTRTVPWGAWRMDTDSPTEPAAWPEYVGPSPLTSRFGGLRRDVSLPRRLPRGRDLLGPGYQALDADEEVRRMRAAGASLAFHNVNSAPTGPRVASTDVGNTVRARCFAGACESAGFPVVLAPDVGTGGHELQSPEDFVGWMIELAGTHAWKLADGRTLLCPYLGEYDPARRWWQASWWLQVINLFEWADRPVALAPVPNSLPDAALDALDPVVSGWGIWGGRSIGANDWVADARRRVAERNRAYLWVSPVSAGQACPAAGRFDEGGGFDQVAATSRQALELCTGPDDLAAVLTWNDFHEGTALGPSLRCPSAAFLDVVALTLGSREPGGEWLGIACRGQLADEAWLTTSRGTSGSTIPRWSYTDPDYRPMVNARYLPYGPPEGTRTLDVVSVLALLDGPADARVRVGGWTYVLHDLVAGWNALSLPLAVGSAPRAEVWRDGKRVLRATSPEPVRARPRLQDLTYLTASSTTY